jgi:hypothetical protein
MIKTFKYGFSFLLMLGLLSCGKIKKKSEQVVDSATSKTKQEIEKQLEKVFPVFDHDKGDTENNKKRFRDFINVEITPDVSQIYCFDDAMGIDTDYMFSFTCNAATSQKILQIHELKLDSINRDNGFSLQHDFNWWDKKRIAQLEKYSWTNGKGYHKYYWYDAKNKKAYFFDFEL